jgi:hypothetical protein
MFHDKITTHAGGKVGPAGIRRTASMRRISFAELGKTGSFR